jgi:hypothetical protein
MGITLDEDRGSGTRHPILKRKVIGESFTGALVKAPEQRDVLKEDKPVLKPNGKPKQELVITLLALPGATMKAGIGDMVPAVPLPGEIVRVIVRGLSFSQWIDAKKAHGGKLHVGDMVTVTTTHGQAYDANGNPTGGKLETQAECDAVPRERSLGMYGDITLRSASTDEADWVAKAEAAYRNETAIVVADVDLDGF